MTELQRFNINEGQLFKTLDLFHNNIVIKDENANDKIIIDFSSIIEIIPVKGSKTDISMKYYSNGIIETSVFSSSDRDNLLSKLITMKDRSSKIISDYSIETFKCYNLTRIDSELLKKIGQKLYEDSKGISKKNELNNKNSNLNDNIAFCTLYRTYSVINKLSSKELKNYYINLSKITKIQIASNIFGLILEDINQIRIVIIPFNQKDVLTIKNLIISYASKYLNYDIKYEESENYLNINIVSLDLSMNKAKSTLLVKDSNSNKKNIGINQQNINNINNDSNNIFNPISNKSKELDLLNVKKRYSHFIGKTEEIKQKDYLYTHNNVYRILYNEDKSEIILKLNYEYILLHFLNNESNVIIKLSDIFIVAIKGSEDKYFEIILENKSRFIFEVEDKYIVINDIIELLLKYYKTRKINERFFVFSYKIGIKKYIRHGEDFVTKKSLEIRKIEEIKYRNDFLPVMKDIVINYYFADGFSKQIQLLLTEPIISILLKKFDECYNKCINCDKKDIKKNVVLLNLFLTLFKNLGMKLLLNNNGKKICEKIFEKLIKELEEKNINKKTENLVILNDYALFYNAIHIFEHFQLYKKIMLLKILSFNKNEILQSIDFNSMYINFLIILFENKLTEITISDDYLSESSCFFLLVTLYQILLYEPMYVLRNAISFLSNIILKKKKKKQREIKDILLKKTLIFYTLIRIFFVNNNFDLLVTKNCLKLFQILLYQYYEISIPIN